MKIDMEFIQEISKDLDGSCRDFAGDGAYSSVFDSDMPNLVIKKSKDKGNKLFSDGWLFYAIYCMRMDKPLPWMPKIYSLLIDFEKCEFFAAMERLEGDTKLPYVTGDLTQAIKRIKEGHVYLPKRTGSSVVTHLKKMDKDLIEFFGLTYSECIFTDAHNDNWMKRGRQVVLTDPFCLLYKVRSDDNLLKFNQDMVKYASGCDNITIKGKPHV